MIRIEEAKRILYLDRTYKVHRVSGSSFIALCLETRMATILPFWWVEKVHAMGLAEIEF